MPIEIRQRFDRGETGLFDRTVEEPVRPAGEFILHEEFQEIEVRERGRLGLRDARGQGVDHAGQAQRAEARRELGIHGRKCSRVYWVIGRIAGSSATRGGNGAAGLASVRRRRVR